MMSENAPRGGGSRFLYEPFDPTMDRDTREYQDIIRALGPPDKLKEKIDAIDMLLEERRRRVWLLTSIKTVASWAAVVAAGWMAFKGVMTEFISGMQK
jgi:hypothetical protein